MKYLGLIIDYRGHRLWISDHPGSGEIHIHALPDEPPPEVVRELEHIISYLLEDAMTIYELTSILSIIGIISSG